MSEYIEIDTEFGDEPQKATILTNLNLGVAGIERYASRREMEEGSAVAQALSVVHGVTRLRIEVNELYVERESSADWHNIVADITAVLKDFFL